MPKGFLRTVLALIAATVGGASFADDAKLVKRSYMVGEYVSDVRPTSTPPSPPVVAPVPAVAPVQAAQFAAPVPTPPPPMRKLPPAVRGNAEALARLVINVVKPYSWAEMGGAGTVTFDEATCSLVVTQTADVHAHVADLFASMRRVHMASVPQVMLEMMVVEVPETFFETAGMDVDVKTAGGTSVPTPACPDGEACQVMKAVCTADGKKPAAATLSADQAQCLMKCIQANRHVSVLSRPQLMLTDTQTGFFEVGQDVQVVTGPELAAGLNGAGCTPQLRIARSGMTIRATPKVSADRRFVELRLNYQTAAPSTVAMKVGEGSEAKVITAPIVDIQAIETTLAFPAGKTVLLAGPVMTRKQVVMSKPVPHVNQGVARRETSPMKCHQLILVTAKVMGQPADCCAPTACKAPSPAADCKACPAECQTVAAAKPARPADAEASRLVMAYHKACADGRAEDALRLAMQALSRDPNCFADQK